MVRTVTSATSWRDAVGMRMSISYSEIDEETGKIISDNKRFDRIVTDSNRKAEMTAILDYAQEIVDNLD